MFFINRIIEGVSLIGKLISKCKLKSSLSRLKYVSLKGEDIFESNIGQITDFNKN